VWSLERVRIGTLGAARITPAALIKPARHVPDVMVSAVAARDPDRARQFAAKHGIPVVHASYDALIDDPGIDAIYNPLPNSLHALWTLRAIEAGKHVLCEKPFTSNAAEAERVAAAAKGSGLVVMEAFHYRYHPLARRMLDVVAGPDTGQVVTGPGGQVVAGPGGQVVAGADAVAEPGPVAGQGAAGELGALRYLEAWVCSPLPRFSDIRYSFDLAGGATMDVGCYAINCLRLLGPGEPQVVEARAKLHGPYVDRAMTASFRFPGGATGRMTASLWSSQVLRISVKAVGDRGVLRVLNFLAPQVYNRLTVSANGYTRHERVRGEATYTYQLRAFAAAVLRREQVITTPDDAVATMTIIDDVYRAAGLPLRGQRGVTLRGERG
jgi:predicted dehydrogenase